MSVSRPRRLLWLVTGLAILIPYELAIGIPRRIILGLRKGRRLAWLFALIGLSVALVRGFGRPNPWAAPQLAFTCDIAPKRCGFGEALSLLHVQVATLEQFQFVGLVMLAVAIAALLAAAWVCRLTASSEGVVIMGALAASYGFSMFVSDVGYLDVALVVLVAICFIVPDRFRAPVSLVCACAGVLVHEGFLVIFLPVTILPLVLANPSRKGLAWALTVGTAALLIVLAIALHKPLTSEEGAAAWRTLQSRLDYPVPYDTVHTLTRSFGDNLRLMLALSKTHWFWATEFAGLAILIPVVVLFATLVIRGWSAPAWAKALAILAALSPLAMNLIGYDVLRWAGLCSLTMLFAALALSRRYGPPRLRSPDLFATVAVILSVLPLALPAPQTGSGAPPVVNRIIKTL